MAGKWKRAVGLGVIALAISAGAVADGGGDRARAAYESRLTSTRLLVDALKPEHARPGVAEVLARAEADLREASMLADVDEYDLARATLDDGYARLTATLGRLRVSSGDGRDAAKLGSGSAALAAADRERAGQTDTPALRAAYGQREASVRTLREACGRLLGERAEAIGKARADGFRKVVANAAGLQDDAADAARSGAYPQGSDLLDRAYLMLKVAIGELQGGEQVVASKNFASPAEEYRYEQSRNDDYAQLISGIVESARRSDWTEALAAAIRQRELADRQAAAGDPAAALNTIAEATLALKAILGKAGFPIM